MEGTVRQRIIEMIKVKPMDAGALSRALGVMQRSVEHHLVHVEKSIGSDFQIIAAKCRDCDFMFKDRSRTTKPTKCPKCKGESILAPQFFVRGQS